MPPVLTISVVVFSALSFLGLYLIVRGLWPRRRGSTRYCRRCGYNLTGLSSERCPECGRELSGRGIVIGTRQRSPVRVLLGVSCLLPLLAVGVGSWRGFDFIPYLPPRVLLLEVKGNNSGRSLRAWTELQRRDQKGRLSQKHRSDLIDMCLQAQGSTTRGPLDSQMLDHLSLAYLGQALSPEQEAQFLKQVPQFTLEVRPKILLGDPVVFQVRPKYRVSIIPNPAGPVPMALLPRASYSAGILIDGRPAVAPGRRKSWLRELIPDISQVDLAVCNEPGRHKLRVPVRWSLSPMGGAISFNPPKIESLAHLEAEFEVLEDEPQRLFERVGASAIDTKLGDRIGVAARYVGVPRDLDEVQISVHVHNSPLNVAAQVLASIDGKRVPLGQLCVPKGGTAILKRNLAAHPLARLNIMLIPDEKLARETLDFYEFWSGSLTFKDVPITGVPGWRSGQYATQQRF